MRVCEKAIQMLPRRTPSRRRAARGLRRGCAGEVPVAHWIDRVFKVTMAVAPKTWCVQIAESCSLIAPEARRLNSESLGQS